LRHALKHRHREVLMIGGQVGVFIDGSHFVLSGGNFVVTGFYRDSQLVQFVLGLQHAGQNAIRNRAEVLIFQLLPFGRLGSEKCAAGVEQIGSGEKEISIDQEILLFTACRRGPGSLLPNSFRIR
jgi:hypothetical protein